MLRKINSWPQLLKFGLQRPPILSVGFAIGSFFCPDFQAQTIFIRIQRRSHERTNFRDHSREFGMLGCKFGQEFRSLQFFHPKLNLLCRRMIAAREIIGLKQTAIIGQSLHKRLFRLDQIVVSIRIDATSLTTDSSFGPPAAPPRTSKVRNRQRSNLQKER
ncbi:MAG: hypothetical protein IPJ30_20645 [Acidobacteria bacterium]|nr:hypothetical protein [Acidobacteriota bacterium]